MKHENLLIVFAALALFSSCGLAPFEEGENLRKPEQTNLQEESSMFEKDEQNKIFTFETNDTKYLGANGWTLWTVPNANTSESFNPVAVEVIKESGRTEAGFGLVFCEQKIEGKPFMLAVLINANGYYTVGKVSDGVFCHINDGWKNSNFINKGYGIKILKCRKMSYLPIRNSQFSLTLPSSRNGKLKIGIDPDIIDRCCITGNGSVNRALIIRFQ